jgi:hypothetical protein
MGVVLPRPIRRAGGISDAWTRVQALLPRPTLPATWKAGFSAIPWWRAGRRPFDLARLGSVVRAGTVALAQVFRALATFSPLYVYATQRLLVLGVVVATLAVTIGGVILGMASVTRLLMALLCGDGPCTE